MAKKKTTKKTTRKATPKPVPVYPVVTGTVQVPGFTDNSIGVDVDLKLTTGETLTAWALSANAGNENLSLDDRCGGLVMVSPSELRPLAEALLQAADRIDEARGVGVVAGSTGYLVLNKNGEAMEVTRPHGLISSAVSEADDYGNGYKPATIHPIGPAMTEQEIADAIARESKGGA